MTKAGACKSVSQSQSILSSHHNSHLLVALPITLFIPTHPTNDQQTSALNKEVTRRQNNLASPNKPPTPPPDGVEECATNFPPYDELADLTQSCLQLGSPSQGYSFKQYHPATITGPESTNVSEVLIDIATFYIDIDDDKSGHTDAQGRHNYSKQQWM